jgi:hypothetical protein
MTERDIKDEYLDASANARHFQTLRFAELTIFIVMTGGLLNALFVRTAPLPTHASAIIKLTGLLGTGLFLILEERTMLYWYNFVNRAAELEKELGFKQYSMRPRAGLASGKNAVRLFFVILLLFWLTALLLFP